MRTITSAVLATASVLWLVGTADGQTPVLFENQHLIASNGSGGDRFGKSVSVDGSVAIVGSRLDSTTGGIQAGSAYVYRFNGKSWVEESHLFASDGAAGDKFGVSVSIDNEVAIVGAHGDDTPGGGFNAGSAYIYRFNGVSWVEEAHLFASNGAVGDEFGVSVSISGGVAIVGSWFDDTSAGVNAGSVYIYRFDGTSWVMESHLFASEPAGGDQFGWPVSISNGNLAIVGAAFDDTMVGSDAGSAYIYRFNGVNWAEESQLIASDSAGGDEFAFSVFVDGNVAIVGAAFDDTTAGIDSGSAYFYRFDGTNWVEEAHLFASDGAPSDFFGASVAVSGSVAIVGAVWDDTVTVNEIGSAYLYRHNKTNWVEESHLFAADGAANDKFSQSVSISGNVAFVGVIFDDTAAGSDAGSVYVFSFDCNGNGISDLADITGGFSLDNNGNGLPDECDCLSDISPIIIGGPIGNGVVNIDDLVTVLNAFGQSTPPGQPTVLGDINYNGVVNIDDLVDVLNSFGPCP